MESLEKDQNKIHPLIALEQDENKIKERMNER